VFSVAKLLKKEEEKIDYFASDYVIREIHNAAFVFKRTITLSEFRTKGKDAVDVATEINPCRGSLGPQILVGFFLVKKGNQRFKTVVLTKKKKKGH
jgi:hypothetical protein